MKNVLEFACSKVKNVLAPLVIISSIITKGTSTLFTWEQANSKAYFSWYAKKCAGTLSYNTTNFIKTRLQRRCFTVNIVKFLRLLVLKNISELRLSILNDDPASKCSVLIWIFILHYLFHSPRVPYLKWFLYKVFSFLHLLVNWGTLKRVFAQL